VGLFRPRLCQAVSDIQWHVPWPTLFSVRVHVSYAQSAVVLLPSSPSRDLRSSMDRSALTECNPMHASSNSIARIP
jgi:hypothetical protein